MSLIVCLKIVDKDVYCLLLLNYSYFVYTNLFSSIGTQAEKIGLF